MRPPRGGCNRESPYRALACTDGGNRLLLHWGLRWCWRCGSGGGRWRGRQQLRPGVVWYVWPVRVGVSGGSRGPLPASLLLLGRCITSVWGLRGQKPVRMSRVFKACMVRVWRSLSLATALSLLSLFFPFLLLYINLYHF